MGKLNWQKRLVQAAWLLAGIGTIVLMGAAMQRKNHRTCSDIRIEITGAERHMFIDEKDIVVLLNREGPVVGNTLSSLDLRGMETVAEKNPWVKNAEMFFDNRQVLQVRIEEREPVARIFTLQGQSFYLDSGGMRLPLSDKLSARVPLFTGFPSDRAVLAGPDSLLLKRVVKLGQYIQSDSFWTAQVAQVVILPGARFELVPAIGDHVVELGTAEDLDNKFGRLYTFYKKAWLQNGINRYEKLDVQYQNQVVAVKKAAAKAGVDSTAADNKTNIRALTNKQKITGKRETNKPKAVMPAKQSNN
ncbi:MAG: hypothetical protein NVSMB63_05980 [Sediminibacterium sp.]